MSHRCRCQITGVVPCVSVDEASQHEIVPVLRLGAAQRAADEALDPDPQMAVFALHVLGVVLAYLILLGMAMPLGGSPAVRVQLRDATRCRVVHPAVRHPVGGAGDRQRRASSSDVKRQPLMKQLLQAARVSPALKYSLQIVMQGIVSLPHGPREGLLCEG